MIGHARTFRCLTHKTLNTRRRTMSLERFAFLINNRKGTCTKRFKIDNNRALHFVSVFIQERSNAWMRILFRTKRNKPNFGVNVRMTEVLQFAQFAIDLFSRSNVAINTNRRIYFHKVIFYRIYCVHYFIMQNILLFWHIIIGFILELLKTA